MKVLAVNLILMHVPWPRVHLILTMVAQKSQKGSTSPDLSQEDVQSLATNTVEKQPNLINDVENHNNPRTLKARRHIQECDLALWLLEQNKKGAAVPSVIVVE